MKHLLHLTTAALAIACVMPAVAELESGNVKEKISYCKILSGSGIEKGMTVFAK